MASRRSDVCLRDVQSHPRFLAVEAVIRKAVLAFERKRQLLLTGAVAYALLNLQRKCLSEPVKPRSVFK